MFLYKIVFLFVSITALHKVSGYALDQCDSGLGIINGSDISIEDAPYMVALFVCNGHAGPFDIYDFYCAATIIHERFLLTSANCVTKRSTQISAGATRCIGDDTSLQLQVEKFIPHKDFNETTGDNNISLVKLERALKFSSKVAKITLADNDSTVDAGTLLNVTGWGATDPLGKYFPADYLQQTTVPVVSNKCCHDDAVKTADDNLICAGTKGRGVCYYDNGGPLTLNGVQVGIVSGAVFDAHCGEGPALHTKVSMYRDWIEDNINNNL